MQQRRWTKPLSLIKIYISMHTQHVSFHCSVLQQRSISLSDSIIIILISHRSSKRLNIQFILYLLYQTTNWTKSYDMIQKWEGKKKSHLKTDLHQTWSSLVNRSVFEDTWAQILTFSQCSPSPACLTPHSQAAQFRRAVSQVTGPLGSLGQLTSPRFYP